jgi:hydrogenase maturation factor
VKPAAFAPHCTPESGCITCSDEGLPLRIAQVDAATGLARCADDGGRESEVDVSLVAPVQPGDRVLVHAGVALTRLEGAAA